MQAILKIISLILWAIDYAKKNPKKATAATLGSGVVAMGLYSGTPTYPPFPVSGTKDDGDVPTVQADDVSVAWEPGGGGGGASDLPDLGDVSDTLTGDTGDIFSFDGTDWDDQTLEEIFTQGIGNGTDDYVLTTDGAGGIGWEAASGGSGITIDGTITDGDTVAYDDTDNVYVPSLGGGPVYDVTKPIGGLVAAGSSRPATITVSSASTAATVSAGWDVAEGHSLVILGAGAAHGISTPSAPYVQPVTTNWVVGDWDAAVSFTVATSGAAADRLVTAEPLVISNGVGCIISNQGGTPPRYVTTTVMTENTAGLYFLRYFPEVQTIAISGTPTGGTYRIYDKDTGNYVTVAYNASSATVQTAVRTMPGWGSVTVAESGSTPNFTHTFTLTGLYGNRGSISADIRLMTGGTPAVTHATTDNGGYKVYLSSANAISDTSALDIDDAGTGTHFISLVGATSYEYDTAALSGNGGWTDDSGDTTITVGNDTLDLATKNRVFVDAVTSAQGYALFGTSTTDGNRFTVGRIGGTVTTLKITADAAGFTPLEVGDMGKTLVQGTHDGKIVGWDNTARTIYVDPIAPGTDTFPGGAAVSWTITSGTGAGTQTSAATNAVYWDDVGDTVYDTPNKRLTRKSSATYSVGEIIIHPASSSGVWYQCIDMVDDRKTAAAAPSFDSDLGDTTRDGNITWQRVEIACPKTLPSAAVPDALWTSASAVSGTSVTLANAATTSVTSMPVLHNDWPSIKAWWDVIRGSSARSSTLFFPGQKTYPIVTGLLAADPQFTSGSMFTWRKTSGTDRLKATLAMDDATLMWQPFDLAGGTNNNGDSVHFLELSYSEPTLRGGRVVCSAFSAPHFEYVSGWNFVMFSGFDGSLSLNWDVVGPYIYSTDILGFPRVTLHGHEPGPGMAEKWVDSYCTYGAAGHDAGWYTPGGTFLGCSLVGVLGDRSTGLYQDDNVTRAVLHVGGNCYFEGWRTDGLRIRASDVTVRDSEFNNCTMIRPTEVIKNVKLLNLNLNRTSILSSFSGSTTTNYEIGGCALTDCGIFLAGTVGGNVHDNDIWYSPTPQSNSSSAFYAVEIVGDDIRYAGNKVDASVPGPDYNCRAMYIAGAGRMRLFENTTKGAGATWTGLYAEPTGYVELRDNYFETRTAAADTWRIVGGSALTWKSSGNTFATLSAAQGILILDGVGRYESDNDTARFGVASGVTGPIFFRNGNAPGAFAVSVAEPGTVLEGMNFVTAPTLSGANIFTSGNRVADALSVTAVLGASTNNDVALPVTDQVRLDPHASNSIVTSFVARADGTEVTIICTDAGAATVTIDSSAATGTAANKIMCPGDTDIVMSTGERIVIRYDATTSLWYVIGGQYVAMDWQGGAIQLWQQGEQINQPGTREWALAA